MTEYFTRQEIEAVRAMYWGGAVLSPRELEELLADFPNPCPMVALCDRHNWRLQLRLEHTLANHRT